MDQKDADFASSNGARRERLHDWLEHHEAGPADDRPDEDRAATDRHFAAWTCSVCGHALGEHVIDHSEEHTLFECPVSQAGQFEQPDPGPLNETGQTKT
jgi:hypothetical protein